MVGYCGGGYRLWLPLEEKLIRSRDVVFDELQMYYKSSKIPEDDTPSAGDQEKKVHQNLKGETENLTDESSDEEIVDTRKRLRRDFGSAEGDAEDENRRKRPRRDVRLPSHLDEYELYNVYCMLSCEKDPESYREAVKDPDWSRAIENEMQSHEKLGTWSSVDNCKNAVPIQTRWVFRTKSDGTKKARLVARGFQEPEEAGGELVYAPVCRLQTVRLLVSFAVQNKWPLRQFDVPTAFLNGYLDHDVYIYPPEGYRGTSPILKLNRALYGLRKAPKCWNDRFDSVMKRIHFRRSGHDACLYVGDNVFLALHVDDAILTGNPKKIGSVMELLSAEFSIKSSEAVSSFLGMKFEQDEGGSIRVTQPEIIAKMAREFRMEFCRSVATPMEIGFTQEELDQFNIHVSRYRPEELTKLIKITKFTRKEIQLIYRGFKQECPTGMVDEDSFKRIFSQFFPQGDASQYAHYVFNTIKHNQGNETGKISFEDFLLILSKVSRGSVQEKLQWVFGLYDLNGDGLITKKEMLEVVTSIYEMVGRSTQPQVEEHSAKEHVEKIFHLIDTNKDGVVTIDELVEWCSRDEQILQSLETLDTVL
ncbi:kv channel-interacting protein [Nesidiocoris tenuis]|uniref:Kv channel-interacting protein n=1 Tax=Nesidiocoris tenuis TaxID=355587 RepID=A0ABN7B7C1_9HEMI|nr:kv channel-interacting protein [Nesidiocoris tenuis]